MNKKFLLISSFTIGILMSGCSAGVNYSKGNLNNLDHNTIARDDEILPPLIVKPKPHNNKV
ncbi:hypothetical protein KIS4809_2153 [Bacillus sp. ZZV12-4809]|nr:hypothetical protein KIS4809_2153 [Bacillus sp. ZZV12-4809]